MEKNNPEIEKFLEEYDYEYPSDTRDDQRKAYSWFESQKNWSVNWPLHRAAMYGNTLNIHTLIKSGIDPNQKMTDWYDSEPLGWAASFGNLQAVIELIKLGADPLRPANKAGNTPLKDAERENYTRVINFLKKYEKIRKGGIPGNDIEEAELPMSVNDLLNQDIGNPSDTREDQKKAYKWFDSNSGWKEKWPLHKAAMHGDLLKIKTLVKDGIDPNQKMTDWYDSEPLGWAASFGNLQAVIELIKLGADPLRPANKAGNTPLKDAERENYTRTIEFLRKYEKAKNQEK